MSRSFYEFWCTLCVTMLLSLGPCHQSLELESMRTGGSSWPQVNPACPLTLSPHSLHPVQLFGWLSWLKTRLKQAKWAQIAHETEPSWRLPDHPDGVGPSHHPSLHCPHHEDDFYLLQYLILTFLAQDMLLQRLKTAILVTVAARYSPLRGQKVSKW